MMSRYGKVVGRLDSWNIVLYTVVCGIFFAEPDTILVFKIYFGVFGEGTRLAMPKTIWAPDSSSLNTTRNMSTCDHHYWSLKGHGFSFATFL